MNICNLEEKGLGQNLYYHENIFFLLIKNCFKRFLKSFFLNIYFVFASGFFIIQFFSFNSNLFMKNELTYG